MSSLNVTADYDEFHDFKQQIRQQLETEYGEFENLTSEKIVLIQAIYSKYFQQFTNDNNRIWTNASLFIPLSLGGLLTLKDSSSMHAAILGMGSTAVMFVWVLLAEAQREFQWRSQLVVDAIEQYLKFDVSFTYMRKNKRSLFNVRKIRWVMLGAVVAVWMLAIIGKSFE